MERFVPREKLLVGGASGSGKTYCFLTIVRALKDRSHVAVEIDDGFERLLRLEFPDIPCTIYDHDGRTWVPRAEGGTTLRIYHCRRAPELFSAQEEVEKLITSGELGRGSWACLDGLDLMYNKLRYAYVERASPVTRRKATSLAEQWEAMLERRNEGAPILEPADWDAIHTYHDQFLDYFAYQIPLHLYGTTMVEVIDLDSRYVDGETKALAQMIGTNVRFEGQKRVPRAFETLLGLKKDVTGYYLSIWKDRGGQGRPWAKAGKAGPHMTYQVNDFYHDIGVRLFGWEATSTSKQTIKAPELKIPVQR